MEPLEQIQDRILDRLHAGEPVDREAILEKHPEHAEALQSFFQVVDAIEDPAGRLEAVPTRLGEFRILGELGRGGMGVVYEAEQISLKRRVALKVLPPALRADRRLLARFRREAEAAGRLRHPNIVPVFSIGEAGGAPFFAMELVEGRSLWDILLVRREGGDAGLPADAEGWRRWVVRTLASVADALAYAHGQGILHRDVKPANILIEPDGTPRLTDFGLAVDLEASSLTVAGEVFGSPRYMSPEQASRREKPLDSRTDIYSLGVTLYELLTLRLPYEGTLGHEVLSALAVGEIVAPSCVDPEFPRGLEEVLLRSLQRDPKDRYVNASDFASELRAALETGLAREKQRPRFSSGEFASLFGCNGLVFVALFVGVACIAGGRACYFSFESNSNEPAHWSNESPGDAASVSADPPVEVDPARRVELAVDGKLAGGFEVLAGLLTQSVRFRHVVARNSPAVCRVEVGFENVPEGLSEDLGVVWTLEYSIDGEPWTFPPRCGVETSVQNHVQHVFEYDLRDVLGDALHRDAFRVRHCLTARLVRRPFGRLPVSGRPILRDGFDASGLTGGVLVPMVFSEETVFLYDEFPENYPDRVSDRVLDLRMARAFTPSVLKFSGLGTASETERSLFFLLEFPSSGALELVPVASKLTLYRDGGESPLAEAVFASRRGVNDHGLVAGVHFELIEGTSQEEFVLDLVEGRIEKLRFVSIPGREVALDQPGFDRYWAGSLDVTIPVE